MAKKKEKELVREEVTIDDRQYRLYHPDEVLQLWEQYKERCRVNLEEVVTNTGKIVVIKKPLVPSLMGFYSYAKINQAAAKFMMSKNYYPLADIRDEVQGFQDECLINGKGNVTGLIFSLKANFGWKDKSEQDIQQKITIEFKEGNSIL